MNQTVLITGASSGLGKSIATHLHTLGYTVFGTSRSPEKYPKSPFPLLALDVNSSASIELLFSELQSRTNQLDVVVNNAGVGITGAVEEVSLAALRDHFDTNFFGPLAVIQMALPLMRHHKKGKIINITSIGASMGLPFRGGYSASKGALHIITEALRMEVAQFGIEVCTIAPGDYATDIAARRYYEPNKIGSPYEALYQESLNTMDAHVDDGNDPIEIAQTVAKLIRYKKIKPHYTVGPFMQKLSLLLKRLLPQKVFERLLMNHYNL
ncbi:MAG: SDR family oxidoreductase [Flavobacteriaceae bacterium]